ncbi:MAG TPA: DUF2239 family protein [Allosphingosinicella sp.]|jgi:hypothetical protein
MTTLTAFLGDAIFARGDAAELARLLRQRGADAQPVRIFEDESGRVTDLDLREAAPPPPASPTRGRPKLGVVPREVTLLPRHWDWLAGQRGGASAALRRLVEEASKAAVAPEARRDAAYRFMSDMCGDRPGYEEALRALYRGDRGRFDALIAEWPEDVRAFIARLLG